MMRANLSVIVKKAHIAIASLALVAVAGCNLTPREVWVYVDNPSDKPLSVEVDGQVAATIKPEGFTIVTEQPGEHHFRLTRGDEVVCDVKKELQQSDRVGLVRKYLLHPEATSHYQTYKAKYGSSRLEGVMQAGLLKYQTDPQLKRQFVYRQLLKEVELLPVDAWSDVTDVDYVLTAPPAYVMTRGTAKKKVLARIEPKFFSRLERMAKIEQPTDEDIDTLDGLIDEILAEAP